VSYGKRVVRNNEVTVSFGPQVYFKATYTADRSKQPMQMDYLLTHGANKGRTQHGIFAFDDNQLKLCFAAPGGERPSEFASEPADGRSFTLWRLAKR
jgi:uncharacterized protein (TIGR03067 family)